MSTSQTPLLPAPPGRQPQEQCNEYSAYPSRPSTSHTALESGIYYASSDIRGVSGNTIYACSEHLLDAQHVLDAQHAVAVIDMDALRLREKIGEGEFGEVHLCELKNAAEPNLVALKLLRPNAGDAARRDFLKERRILSRLRHPNIVQLIGVSSDGDALVVEYMSLGDLNQYLSVNTVTFEQQMHLCNQLAAGLAYLEAHKFVHRDVASRNCLVGPGLSLKLADFGMARSLYSNDYYRIQGKFVLPIRWMAWESLLMGTFTTKSDVWAFAVTVWEVLVHCRQQPFGALGDEEVIDNIQLMYHHGYMQHYLPQPENCPDHLYQVLVTCWSREEADRPPFRDLAGYFASPSLRVPQHTPSTPRGLVV